MTGSAERFVLFRSGGGAWALSASGVGEILPTAAMERPAGSPRALAGFLNVGGSPLAVVRLAVLLGGEVKAEDEFYHHIIRLSASAGSTPLGLLVERVLDVSARSEGMAPLDAGQSVNGALIGNLVVDGQLVPLLDWGRLLLVEEEARIADLAGIVRARLTDVAAGPD